MPVGFSKSKHLSWADRRDQGSEYLQEHSPFPSFLAQTPSHFLPFVVCVKETSRLSLTPPPPLPDPPSLPTFCLIIDGFRRGSMSSSNCSRQTHRQKQEASEKQKHNNNSEHLLLLSILTCTELLSNTSRVNSSSFSSSSHNAAKLIPATLPPPPPPGNISSSRCVES